MQKLLEKYNLCYGTSKNTYAYTYLYKSTLMYQGTIILCIIRQHLECENFPKELNQKVRQHKVLNQRIGREKPNIFRFGFMMHVGSRSIQSNPKTTKKKGSHSWLLLFSNIKLK